MDQDPDQEEMKQFYAKVLIILSIIAFWLCVCGTPAVIHILRH